MAADLTQTFWGKHFEKIIVLAAAAIFIISLVFFAVVRTPQGRLLADAEQAVKAAEESRKVPVAEREEAEYIQRLMEGALTAHERTDLGIGQPLVTPQDLARQLTGLSPALESGKDFVQGLAEIEVGSAPPTPSATPEAPMVQEVTNIEVVVGRGTTTEAVPTAVFHLDKPSYSDIVWAGCAGQFDLTAQVEAYWQANNPSQPIILARVELQRRELKADGSWSDWQAVTPALPKAAADKWPKLPANPRDVREVGDWGVALSNMQAAIRLMPLYPLVAVDEEGQTTQAITGNATGVEQPELTPPKPAAAPAAAPEAAPPATEPAASAAVPAKAVTSEEDSPWAARAPSAAKTTAAPTEAARNRVVAWVSAYDTSVMPGVTYQYQMRVALRNPVYSLARVEDPKVRWAPMLSGEWSQPTQAVTIPPLVQFYFIGVGGDKPNVELQRWVLGQWIKVPSVQCNLGSPIYFVRREQLRLPGSKDQKTKDTVEVDLSPQVVLVDVIHNFPYQPEGNARPIRTNVLVCAAAAGRLFHRIEWEDKKAAANDWLARTGKVAAPSPASKPTAPPVTKPAAPTPKPEKPPAHP